MRSLYILLFVLSALPVWAQPALEITPRHDYDTHFETAYKAHPEIPRGMLEAIAYVQTHIRHINPEDGHPSCSAMPAYHGVMGLIADGKGWFNNSLEAVSRLSGQSASYINSSPERQITAYADAYAQLMLQYGLPPNDPAAHVAVLNDLSELPNDGNIGSDFAFDSYLYNLYRHLNDPQFQTAYGLPAYDIDLVELFGRDNHAVLSSGFVTASPDKVHSQDGSAYNGNAARNSMACSDTAIPVLFVAADPSNYSSRSGTAISALTIHTMQGTYAGAISWFQNPSANVSAHYNFRSSDGQITQMVCEIDKAWHVGSENPYTIGFEHDGYVEDHTWYTNVMYNSSANLAVDIANRYGIPTVRTHDRNGDSGLVLLSTGCFKIKGHQHYPNQSHVDPGPNWDWNRYYDLLNPDPTPSTYTACSGSFQDSGGAGNYSDDLREFYLIQPTGATEVTLTFSSLNLETNYDYLYIYDGDSDTDELIATLNGNTPPAPIVGASGSLLLEFRTDCGTTTAGWDASWTCSTAASPCGTPANISHSHQSPYNVNFTWDAVPGATSYSIRIKGNLDGTWNYYTTSDTNYSVDGLLPNDHYTWGVSAICASAQSPYNGYGFDGFGVMDGAYTATNCSGVFIDNGGTTGDYRNGEDWTLTISPPGATSVTLTFTAFELEQLGGSGQIWDYMEFYDGPSTASPQIGTTYTANNSPGTISSTGGSLTILFHSDNATIAPGWEATWTCASSTPTLPNPIVMGSSVSSGNLDCGLSYHNFYDSGNSAGLYQNNESYTQTICNPDPSGSVRLTFLPLPALNEQLELIASTTGNDYLYIYDGEDTNGNLVGVYTGSTLNYPQPGTFISSTNCVTVTFESDNFANGSGWDARAYCSNRPTSNTTNNNVGCTVCSSIVTFTDSGGTAADYSNGESYTMTYCPHASAPSGEVVWAEFAGTVGLEQNWDYLYVFDGNSTADRCIGIYTGNATNTNTLGTIKATEDNPSGCLTFQFYSDGATTASGWSANMVTGLPRKSFGSEDCADATLIQQFDVAYAGSTVLATGKPSTDDSDLNIEIGSLPECSGSNAITRLESTVWYKFATPSDICTASEVNLTLTNISCQNEIVGGSGIQFVLYETASCLSGASWGTPIYCADKLLNGDQVDVKPYISPGLDYYVMIDGFTGQHCNFDLTMSAVGGVPDDCLLPIELLTFDGENQGAVNHLFWTTGSEENNEGFHVQRGFQHPDGSLRFEDIGAFVPSLSVNGEGADYEFDDPDYRKGEVNYYRLRQMDFDGSEHFHKIIQIVNPSDEEIHELFPNPVGGELFLNVKNPKGDDYSLSIYNAAGQLIMQENISPSGGGIQFSMSVSHLPAGVYWYQLQSEMTTHSGKLVKR